MAAFICWTFHCLITIKIHFRLGEILDEKMKAARGHGSDAAATPAYAASSHLSGRALAEMALSSVARAERELRKVRQALCSYDGPPCQVGYACYPISALYRALPPAEWHRFGKRPRLIHMTRAACCQSANLYLRWKLNPHQFGRVRVYPIICIVTARRGSGPDRCRSLDSTSSQGT